MAKRDWRRWHEPYDRPGSSLSRRLAAVQRRILAALDAAPPGPIRVLSMCAGQGRDLLPVLAAHPRRAEVSALLVELDPRNAEYARESARAAGLAGVRVATGDAALCSAYEGVVPVRLALVCGVFGNVVPADVERTVRELPRLCGPGATVVWTRHRGAPDATPAIRDLFAANGFTEVGFDTDDGFLFGVGTHRLTGPALPYRRDGRLFEFVGDGAEAHR